MNQIGYHYKHHQHKSTRSNSVEALRLLLWKELYSLSSGYSSGSGGSQGNRLYTAQDSANPIRNTRSWFSAHQTVNHNPWWFNFIKVTLEQYVSENWKLHGYVNVTIKCQHSFVRRP